MGISFRTAVSALEMYASAAQDVRFSEDQRRTASEHVVTLWRELSSLLDRLEASNDYFDRLRASSLRRMLKSIEERFPNSFTFTTAGGVL